MVTFYQNHSLLIQIMQILLIFYKNQPKMETMSNISIDWPTNATLLQISTSRDAITNIQCWIPHFKLTFQHFNVLALRTYHMYVTSQHE